MTAIADSCSPVVFLADPAPCSAMPNACRTIRDEAVCVPPLVALEMARKSGQGGLPLVPVDLSDALRQRGFLPLLMTREVAEISAKLPPVHKDPIDGVPVAHSAVQGMPILASDRTIPRYGVPTIW